MAEQGTDRDRSPSYRTDPLVRAIEDHVRATPAHRRLYPDIWAEALAGEIRSLRTLNPRRRPFNRTLRRSL